MVLTDYKTSAIIAFVESLKQQKQKTLNGLRKCRNWQTSKTKDLVTVRSCGFKSHLPHQRVWAL